MTWLNVVKLINRHETALVYIGFAFILSLLIFGAWGLKTSFKEAIVTYLLFLSLQSVFFIVGLGAVKHFFDGDNYKLHSKGFGKFYANTFLIVWFTTVIMSMFVTLKKLIEYAI